MNISNEGAGSLSGMPKCDHCGRFHNSMKAGSSFAMRYSGWPLMPDHEATRCVACTEKYGALEPQHGVAAWTAGVMGEHPSNEGAGTRPPHPKTGETA